ncbi:MAG: ImmA/IrrE family metallo-endopeptidase [Gammaproteobacteria bacterium]
MAEYRQSKLTDEENNRIDKFQKALPKAPVDIVKLSESFGLAVWRAELPQGISGAIRREGDGYAIYANKNEPMARRRFTYAHELAHFFLHKDDIGDGLNENVLFRSSLTNDKEVAANKIAAEILVPLKILNELAETKKYGVRELAEKFGVSRSTMLLRLGIPSS